MSRLSGLRSLWQKARQRWRISQLAPEQQPEPKRADKPVDDTLVVQGLQAKHDLSDVASRPVLVEGAELFDEGTNVSTWKILHDEEEVVLVLKREEEANDPVRLRLVH